MAGIQLGLFNYADRMKGLQLGLINMAGELRGIQLGLLNFNFSGIPVLPLINIGWSF